MGFETTEKIYIPYDLSKDDKSWQKIIFVDKNAKKMGLINYSKRELLIVKFNEIAGCQTNVGIGAPSYDMLAVDNQLDTSVIELIINLKNYEDLPVRYKLVDSVRGIRVGSEKYHNLVSRAQKVREHINLLLSEK